MTWHSGECGTTGPIVHGWVQRPSGVRRPRLECTPSCGLASLLSSLFLDVCRGRLETLLERVFRVCGRRSRRSSERQPWEPSEDFCTAFQRLLLWGSGRRRLLASYQVRITYWYYVHNSYKRVLYPTVLFIIIMVFVRIGSIGGIGRSRCPSFLPERREYLLIN